MGMAGRSIRRARVAGALLVVCALGACSQEPVPKFDDPPTRTPTSETPTPTPSPSATSQLDPEETVRAWVKARNQALRTGDTSAVRALSDPQCRTCTDLLTPIEKVYANGGYFHTDGWKVVSSRLKSQAGRKAEVPIAVVYAAGSTVPEAGADPVRYDEVRRIATFRLLRGEGSWRVSFIGFLS